MTASLRSEISLLFSFSVPIPRLSRLEHQQNAHKNFPMSFKYQTTFNIFFQNVSMWDDGSVLSHTLVMELQVCLCQNTQKYATQK